MPSTRVVITILAAIAGMIGFFSAKGSYPPGSNWPLGWAMGAFILVYVVGNILWGVVQGMREARLRPPPPPPAPAPPSRRPSDPPR